jgi:hypothetical protein
MINADYIVKAPGTLKEFEEEEEARDGIWGVIFLLG